MCLGVLGELMEVREAPRLGGIWTKLVELKTRVCRPGPAELRRAVLAPAPSAAFLLGLIDPVLAKRRPVTPARSLKFRFAMLGFSAVLASRASKAS